MRQKSYFFDESIAPLTPDEKTTMKNYENLKHKINKIYERTDKVIKKFRENKRKQEKLNNLKLQKELKLKEQLKQQSKVDDFFNNYTIFKNKFNELLFMKNQKTNINKLRIDFRDKCIHPHLYDGFGSKIEYNECGGGQGLEAVERKVNVCLLCGEWKPHECENDNINESSNIIDKYKQSELDFVN